MDTEVLVVGAGPTGLMLACQLARRGVRLRIIDRHTGPARETRALGVQARTLEIYAQLGIAERAIALGKIGTGANMWAQGKRMARAPIGDAGKGLTPYPYILILGQDDNEAIMGEALRGLGVSVEWGVELVGLEQTPDGARAKLRKADGGEQETRARWVAGCDGARSAVREMSGITFPGAPYEHVFYVADVEATGAMVPDEVNVFLWRRGFDLMFPMRGDNHWRFVGILPRALRGRSGVGFEDVLPALSAQAGDALRVKSCSWFSTYRIHHRSAERFRAGRCFLLGDAAHIHSPVGAQGMNTGLQDAYNLGWKLALVAAGRADEALLDSYEAERIPVAKTLLATTDRAFKLVVSDSPLAGLLRAKVIARIAAAALSSPRIQRAAFGRVSQIGIRYRGGPLSQPEPGLPAAAPSAGDRFPWMRLKLRAGAEPEDMFAALSDLSLHLLLFGQPAPAAEAITQAGPFGDLLHVHAIPADEANAAELTRVGVPALSYYLLRPDGHIGLAGARCDPAVVSRYLAQRLRLRADGGALLH